MEFSNKHNVCLPISWGVNAFLSSPMFFTLQHSSSLGLDDEKPSSNNIRQCKYLLVGLWDVIHFTRDMPHPTEIWNDIDKLKLFDFLQSDRWVSRAKLIFSTIPISSFSLVVSPVVDAVMNLPQFEDKFHISSLVYVCCAVVGVWVYWTLFRRWEFCIHVETINETFNLNLNTRKLHRKKFRQYPYQAV